MIVAIRERLEKGFLSVVVAGEIDENLFLSSAVKNLVHLYVLSRLDCRFAIDHHLCNQLIDASVYFYTDLRHLFFLRLLKTILINLRPPQTRHLVVDN